MVAPSVVCTSRRSLNIVRGRRAAAPPPARRSPAHRRAGRSTRYAAAIAPSTRPRMASGPPSGSASSQPSAGRGELDARVEVGTRSGDGVHQVGGDAGGVVDLARRRGTSRSRPRSSTAATVVRSMAASSMPSRGCRYARLGEAGRRPAACAAHARRGRRIRGAPTCAAASRRRRARAGTPRPASAPARTARRGRSDGCPPPPTRARPPRAGCACGTASSPRTARRGSARAGSRTWCRLSATMRCCVDAGRAAPGRPRPADRR